MDGWNRLSASISGLNLGQNLSQTSSKLAKGFSSSVQATRERLGQVPSDELTELPQEYKDLETRVDALRSAHILLLKIGKAYESETYDYPVQVQESLSEFGTNLGVNITNFAATNLKGTNLPTPSPVHAPVQGHKTLPHALSRAAVEGAQELGEQDALGRALMLAGEGWAKVGEARVKQDKAIKERFLNSWGQALNTSINLAMKARQAVKVSRLELDAAKQTLKSASPNKQDQARLQVENAEDDLVQKTEVAITLMKAVLENPESISSLNNLIKSQITFYAAAADALNSIQGDLEELAVAKEGEYRKSRDH